MIFFSTHREPETNAPWHPSPHEEPVESHQNYGRQHHSHHRHQHHHDSPHHTSNNNNPPESSSYQQQNENRSSSQVRISKFLSGFSFLSNGHENL
jgi:hypothetical protein